VAPIIYIGVRCLMLYFPGRANSRRKITHLETEFPVFKPAPQASLYEHACGPPDEQCQLDPRVDDEAIGRLIRIAPDTA